MYNQLSIRRPGSTYEYNPMSGQVNKYEPNIAIEMRYQDLHTMFVGVLGSFNHESGNIYIYI